MKILVYVISFFLIFGPKFGPIDTSSLASISLLVLCSLKKEIKVNSFLVSFSLILSFLIIYSVFLVIIFKTNDNYVYLRNIRALINTVSIGLFFYNFKVDTKFSYNLLINLLSINSLVIIIQIVFVNIQYTLAPIYNFDKKFVALRAFGLTAGFDSAGYLCILGLVFILSKILHMKKIDYRDILFFYLFSVAGCFTGRSVMFIMILCVISLNIYLIFNKKSKLRFFALTNFIVGGILVYKFILPIIITTLPFLKDQNLITLSLTETEDFKYSYSSGTGELLTEMWFLPKHTLSAFFGTGIDPYDSDVGYIKIIFMIGFLGLMIIFFYYISMLYKTFILKSKDSYTKILLLSLKASILFLFIFNLKTLYFFSRSFHEIINIAFFSVLSSVLSEKSATQKNINA